MSIGFLTKYLFIYLILTIKIIFILNLLKKKNFKIKFLIPGTIFIFFLTPHIIWLFQNNFVTITYALIEQVLMKLISIIIFIILYYFYSNK